MIIVLAHVDVAADQIAQALATSKEHVARSLQEPGCLSHAVYQDPDMENRLVFVEEWESTEALQVHFTVPESLQFVEQLRSWATSPPKIRIFDATELPFPGA